MAAASVAVVVLLFVQPLIGYWLIPRTFYKLVNILTQFDVNQANCYVIPLIPLTKHFPDRRKSLEQVTSSRSAVDICTTDRQDPVLLHGLFTGSRRPRITRTDGTGCGLVLCNIATGREQCSVYSWQWAVQLAREKWSAAIYLDCNGQYQAFVEMYIYIYLYIYVLFIIT